MRTTRSLIIFSIATVLLLVPLIAMQLSTEVDWSTGDFLLAALLLFGTGTAIEIAFRKVAGTRKRLFAIGLILFLLLLIWAELAVGVFGSPIAGS
jgi:hypothetical protein